MSKVKKQGPRIKRDISDKAILAHIRRWAKKHNYFIKLSDKELLLLRDEKCHVCGGSLRLSTIPLILRDEELAVEASNILPTCGACKLFPKTEAFDPLTFCKAVLRRNWKKTPYVAVAKQKAKRGPNTYECAKCLELFKEKQMQLDHIDPVSPLYHKNTNLEEWALRLVCSDTNLQYLCKPCHLEKTKKEATIRSLHANKKDRIITKKRKTRKIT